MNETKLEIIHLLKSHAPFREWTPTEVAKATKIPRKNVADCLRRMTLMPGAWLKQTQFGVPGKGRIESTYRLLIRGEQP